MNKRGHNLREITDEKKEKNEYFSISKTASYMKNLIYDLDDIHCRGVIHKSITLENIIEKEEILKIKVLEESDNNNDKINSNEHCCECSDIFDLGCILYEIYTLKRLFDDDDRDRIVNDDYKKIFKMDDFNRFGGIECLLERMLEKRIDIEGIKYAIAAIEEGIKSLSFRVQGTYNCKTISIWQRGGKHREPIWLTKINIPNRPPEVNKLYYECPNEGNRLLSVNMRPTYMNYTGVIEMPEYINSIDEEFVKECENGNWWWDKKKGYEYVPVYQLDGNCSSRFVFRICVPIEDTYKSIIKNLYYDRSEEGGILFSINVELSLTEIIEIKNELMKIDSEECKDKIRIADGNEGKDIKEINEDYLNKI